MPKFTAVYRVYDNSKYDGSCKRAELSDLLDENGNHVDETHYLWTEETDELFLWTDNPSVYGYPDDTHTVFGQQLDTDDFINNVDQEYGKYENGDTNYEVQYVKVEFEAEPAPVEGDQDRWEIVLPLPEFVYAQSEVNNNDAEILFGYFRGERTPTAEQVQGLYESQGDLVKAGKLSVVGCLGWTTVGYDVERCPNVLSELAGLKRYVLGYLS